MPKYDYIIIGAGASGLLLADAMGKNAFFAKKSILIIDKATKKTNDRTWCFWEEGDGDFESILHKTWSKISFAGQELRKSYEIAPYQYKMVQGIDFYNHYLVKLEQFSNITLINDEVVSVKDNDKNAVVITKKETYKTLQVFNSVFSYEHLKQDQKYPILQQHFLGWFVNTERPIFKKDEATFMDFSIPQKENTRFMYVLPFSENKALVEYTLFSEKPLDKSEYEEAIKLYLEDKNSGDYTILETEKGNIPMTCYNFQQHNSEHIFNIGTAGGWAKASTGYTFMKTNKNIKALIGHLTKGKHAIDFSAKNRFWYYDLLLLDILHRNNKLGRSIFESLFKKRSPKLIFKFLDEETSILEDVKIMMAPKPLPFIKALFQRVF
ncbi:lycopene cyclase family protein [Croceitalea rosinachiae]|uniref:Lycopene cyclase family protein n=1 Tax=Croceitalea rosinachiae TaxID=3075596 RepID=A0ABU3A788_9FLAO|nr:lycopene cyclase family protein [Croceitalea sp. F388]MDT0606026.1 lycopene cyclase family protein [Croceitalea sp. F388]